MRRRDFVASIAAAAAWPLVARGQPSGAARIGLLANLPDSAPSQAFRSGLTELGYSEDRNIHVDGRFFEGRFERLSDLARELVASKPDVIAVIGAVEARALKTATSTIPVVFAIVPDPMAAGLVPSNSQPGGNLTGTSSFDPQQPKQQLQILKEALPDLKRLAIMGDAAVPNVLFRLNEAEATALGLQTQLLKLTGANPDLEEAFDAARQQRADALLVLEHPSTDIHRHEIAKFAVRDRLPTMFPRDFIDADWTGLIGYGTSLADAARMSAVFVDKILKGAKPSELSVAFASRRELILNLRTVRQFALTLAPSLRSRANRVIE